VSQFPIISAGLHISQTLWQEQKEWLDLFIRNSTVCVIQALLQTVSDSCPTNPRVLLPCLGSFPADIELLESVEKFAVKVCTKCWREPYIYLWNLLKLPLLKDRTKLKLTVVTSVWAADGHAIKFFPTSHSSWNLRSNDTISASAICSYLYSCVPNSVSLWNQFPENIHHSPFKSLIDNLVEWVQGALYTS